MSFFDLQVNGYAGVDFNSPCDPEEIHGACEALARDEVEGILATIVTADLDTMIARLSQLVRAKEESDLAQRMIRGIHIEGPFISPCAGYVGAHPAQHVRSANVPDMSRLWDAGNGDIRLVTLAPEQDAGQEVTRWLSERNVTVAAGHCDADLDQLQAGMDAGLSMFTHLGNGCPATLPRHDNIIQRALSLSDHLWCCFIPDGVHLPFYVLKNYIHLAGLERSLVVTDSIAAAGMPPGTYRLGERSIEIGADRIARQPGTQLLAGSTLTAPTAQRHLNDLGFTPNEITRLCASNPQLALGLSPDEPTEST